LRDPGAGLIIDRTSKSAALQNASARQGRNSTPYLSCQHLEASMQVKVPACLVVLGQVFESQGILWAHDQSNRFARRYMHQSDVAAC